ncbi:hypothetical protein Glove_51g30 [Diversispora epigaea]|uniref:Uncharacterized protein n=1 Tax=Diversispora epigaea TaxID=1348612 RepID=A0A397JED0_9GLOM|nr:hypothetical protein Glove_51g30 [Diversispora epigaea]
MNNNNNLNNNMNSSNSNNKLTSRQRNIRRRRITQQKQQEQQQEQQQQEWQQQLQQIPQQQNLHCIQGACNEASLQEKFYYEKYLWKSQSLEPTDKISTRSQNQLHLYYLLAGVLIREYTRNYSLELSNIPSDYLELIISNIIIKNNINLNIKTWDYFRLCSFEIDNELHIKSSDMIDLAQGKYRSTRLESFTYPKSAHCLVNPGCIVNQNNQILIHLENIDNTNILLHTTNAVNTYYYHMVNDEKHRSESFWRDLTKHYGAYRLYTDLLYTSFNSASSHNTDHQSCVDELIRSLVPLSNFVNKFIQDNYNSMYSAEPL